MKTRSLYATVTTLLALLTTFYAVMTLAFFFGEGRTEWLFPLFITVIAIINIYAAVKLWRRQNAVWPVGITLLAVAAITGWIVIPPGTWDVGFVIIVLAFLASLGMLLALSSKKVRKSLS